MVWNGICGIQDLAKIWCGNRENDKCIDRIRDLTVPPVAGFAKNLARDTGFMFVCLSVGNAGNRHNPPALVAKANKTCERLVVSPFKPNTLCSVWLLGLNG